MSATAPKTESTAPHSYFDLLRPDEIAECWEGIDTGLYQSLWKLVQYYEEMDVEEGGPADFIGINCVSKFWDKLTPEQQAQLNEVAQKVEERNNARLD